MRKLLARIGLPLLAATALAGASTTLAQADPPTYNHYCKDQVVAAYVTARTCVNVTTADATYVNATVTIYNNSGYTVYAQAFLSADTWYEGTTGAIESGQVGGGYTQTVVFNSPQLPNLSGYGYVITQDWQGWTANR